MLTEFRLIRNIGKYENCSGAPGLKKITLVHSENARGKTTLTAILRSLAENSPAHITVRQRLGTVNLPEIKIISSQNSHVFQNGAWNTPYADMLVFDDHFVDSNVYSGLAVGRGQCNGLHEVILGAQSAALAREIEQIIGQINDINGELRQARADIQPHAVGMPLDDFLALPVIDNAEQHIEASETVLNQIRQSDPIRQQGAFDAVEVPLFMQETITSILSRSLANVDQNAIARVDEHFRSLGQGGEQWIQVGMGLAAHRPNCPFCNQDIQRQPLLVAYRAYFSQEYEQHIQQISSQTAQVLELLASAIGSIRQAATIADARRTFWCQYIADLPPIPDYSVMADCGRSLQEQIQQAFHDKRESPLSVVAATETLLSAIRSYAETRERFLEQQQALLANNADIQRTKTNAQTGDKRQIEADLRRLRATIVRHSANVDPLIKLLQNLQQQKDDLEKQRDNKRTQLDQQRQARFPQYQTAVNNYLRRFGADFQIANVAPDNRGAAPSVRYGLKVNGTDIGIDVFKHTLSAGDRSALALAFFFARLDAQTNIADLTVVLDDPFTSMDRHRSFATVQTIRALHQTVGQLIVLSHDGAFLWQIQDGLPEAIKVNDLICLQVVQDRGWNKSTFSVLDIVEQERTLYDDNHEKLRTYSREAIGVPREIAPLLRPVMEFYCRVAFPENYPPGKMLGQFREEERVRRDKGDGIIDDHDFRELVEITDFANKFHHQNPNYEQELRSINQSQLRSFVDRVLEFAKHK